MLLKVIRNRFLYFCKEKKKSCRLTKVVSILGAWTPCLCSAPLGIFAGSPRVAPAPGPGLLKHLRFCFRGVCPPGSLDEQHQFTRLSGPPPHSQPLRTHNLRLPTSPRLSLLNWDPTLQHDFTAWSPLSQGRISRGFYRWHWWNC